MPLTTVPGLSVGVMVTVMVRVWPGPIGKMENDANGLTAPCQKSPVPELTAGSNSLVTAETVTRTLPFGAGLVG